MLGDELASDAQAGLRGGRADELENGGIAGQWLSSPMLADLAEETVFDGIPLGGTDGKVADRHDQFKVVGHFLQGPFPHAHAGSVASATVGQNEQVRARPCVNLCHVSDETGLASVWTELVASARRYQRGSFTRFPNFECAVLVRY